MLDAVNCKLQLQVLEAFVCLNVCEGLFEGCFRSVAGEGFEHGIRVGFANLLDYGLE
jgi:hypothetical protein